MGTVFPATYQHDDGGAYSGEWQQQVKQGVGVYRYRSKAVYEGEWRGNLKDGRGVYYFAKGGVYEGEWRGGEREGVGVQTFANGQVKVRGCASSAWVAWVLVMSSTACAHKTAHLSMCEDPSLYLCVHAQRIPNVRVMQLL